MSTANRPVRKRKANYSLYILLVLIIVFVTFAILSTTIFFKIDHIVVTGDSRYTSEEIISASTIKGGDNLIRTNMKNCCENIEQTLLYIEKAEIKRVFPSTVSIIVTKAVPTVNVKEENQYYILSQNGKVLEILDSPIKGALTITGSVPADNTCIGKQFSCSEGNKTDIFYRLVDIYKNSLDEKITSFDMEDYLNISCLYDNRITIEFGAASDLDYKLKLADDILKTKISDTAEGTLKMLNSGASFIDKDGLELNQQIFESNMMTSADTTFVSDEIGDNSSEGSESQENEVNFE